MVEKKKRPVQSVERALDILDCVSKHGMPMRSVDIAKHLSLHPSTANNLIRTLYRRGYLSQVDGGRYGIGIQCYVLGESVNRWEELSHLCLPIIQRLSEETGDNSYVGVLEDGRLLTIAYGEGTAAVVVSRKHAWAEQVHCTAAGKVLLAYDPQGLDALGQGSADLPRYTAYTITDLALLRKETEKTRKIGYAESRDEGCEGVTALGVPVLADKSLLLCALSQAFPTYNITSGKLSISARVILLKRYAGEIARSYKEKER
jgi:IclR family KDG regulon transcriptional repressor